MLDQDLRRQSRVFCPSPGSTHQWLSVWVHLGPVERMAREDLYIRRQVFLECVQFRSLARRLPTDDGPDFGSFLTVSNPEPSCILEQGTYTAHTVRRPVRSRRLLHCI